MIQSMDMFERKFGMTCQKMGRSLMNSRWSLLNSLSHLASSTSVQAFSVCLPITMPNRPTFGYPRATWPTPVPNRLRTFSDLTTSMLLASTSSSGWAWMQSRASTIFISEPWMYVRVSANQCLALLCSPFVAGNGSVWLSNCLWGHLQDQAQVRLLLFEKVQPQRRVRGQLDQGRQKYQVLMLTFTFITLIWQRVMRLQPSDPLIASAPNPTDPKRLSTPFMDPNARVTRSPKNATFANLGEAALEMEFAGRTSTLAKLNILGSFFSFFSFFFQPIWAIHLSLSRKWCG